MSGISTTTGPAVAGDPFLEQFFSRLPEEMRTDFTDRQLAGLKSVFGDATRSGHGFDIRLSIPTPLIGPGLYMVFLGGRDRRSGQQTRRSLDWRGLASLGKLIVGALFVFQLLFAAITLVIWLS